MVKQPVNPNNGVATSSASFVSPANSGSFRTATLIPTALVEDVVTAVTIKSVRRTSGSKNYISTTLIARACGKLI